MQVVVDTLLAHYESKGKGKVIVLLHGWADSVAGFKDMQESLSGNYQVIAVDLPGFGASGPPPIAWGLSEYARFIEHFLDKIGVKKVKAIIGHSNGGAIAIRGLGQGWLQADKLVLIASSGIRGVYRGRLKALRLITKSAKVLAMPLPKNIKKRLRRKLYKAVGSDMLIAEHLQETFKKIINDDVREDAKKIKIPVLLIYGEDDSQAPMWYGQQFRELMTHSSLEVIPTADHFIHHERPKEIFESISEFL